MRARTAMAATTIGGVAAGIGWQRWRRRWRATPEEQVAALAGDDHVAEPATQSTLAVEIDAPVEDVWPWIVQLGADRGGFYSYDWLENLFGLGIHSASRVVPEWQVLDVGDVIAADRAGTGGWYVVALIPVDTLAIQLADFGRGRVARRDEGLRWEFLWTFALVRVDEQRCRLLVRERVAFGRRLARWAMTPFAFVSFVMTRRMMLGIRLRATSRSPCVAPGTAGETGRQGPGRWSRPCADVAHRIDQLGG